MRSLKADLTTAAVGTAAVVLCAASLALYGAARVYLVSELDQRVAAVTQLVASSIELENGRLEMEFEGLHITELSPVAGKGFFEITLDDQLLVRTPHDAGMPPGLDGAPPDRACWIDLGGGTWARGYVRAWSLPDATGPRMRVSLAVDASGPLAALNALAVSLIAVGTVALAVLVLAMRLVVARSLRPVIALGQSLRARETGGLADDMDTAGVTEELRPVIAEVNVLLARVRQTLDRERAFSANAAHELRTPLAGLLTTLEVAQSSPKLHPDAKPTLDRCLTVSRQLKQMVDALMHLARLENGRDRYLPAEIDLADEANKTWEQIRKQSTDEKHFEIRQQTAELAPAWAEPLLVRLVLRNVLCNAAHHVDDGGWVAITSASDPAGASITIENTGSLVSEDDVTRVFEPFWRGDAARSLTGLNAGLGLSLARRAAERCGGSITASSQAGGNFKVVISLPSPSGHI